MPTTYHGSFEWDTVKARANLRKHGISFEEASTVFSDTLSAPYHDPLDTERFVLIGMSLRSNLLLVVFAERDRGERIRIISARRASARERKAYEEGE